MKRIMLVSLAGLVSGAGVGVMAEMAGDDVTHQMRRTRHGAMTVDVGANASDDAIKAACRPGMKLVNGTFCEIVRHTCKRWLDPPDAIIQRCAEYDSTRTGREVCQEHTPFCIDEIEATVSGEEKPIHGVSWMEAKGFCERNKKRLCTDHEWTHACEGTAGNPYPQGNVRSAGGCNIDSMDLTGSGDRFKDGLRRSGAAPGCVSEFGVLDLVGNVDEWVSLTAPQPYLSGLKGGWWGPLRNRCRPTTTGHDELYKDIQTGFRCCAGSHTTKLVE